MPLAHFSNTIFSDYFSKMLDLITAFTDSKLIILTRMLISIVSRPCMNDIIIIDHVLFTHQLSDTKLWSKYCELKWY